MLLGFLNPLALVRSFRLKRAVARYRANPSKAEAISLARILERTGDPRVAVDILRDWRRRAPQDQEVRALYQELWSRGAQREIKSLERAFKKNQNARDLARLIELHRSVQGFDRCLELAREYQNLFPGSWVLDFAVGKALYHRYLTDGSPEDGQAAAARLRAARTLKQDSPRILLYLAALLVEIGPAAEATQVVEELSRLAPNDPQAQRLRAILKKGRPAGKRAVAAARAGQKAAARKAVAGSELLETLMGELRENPEVFGALIFGPSGEVAYEHLTQNELFSIEAHEKAIVGLARALQTAAERVGIGRLQTCAIEGSEWRIFFAEVAGCPLVVLAGHGFSPVEFERLANRFLPQGVAL